MPGNNDNMHNDGDAHENGGAHAGGNGINSTVSLTDALKLVRRYNGRTSVEEWIRKFESDVLAFGIPFRYVIRSLDRFLSDDALNWWSSVAHSYEENDPKAPEEVFEETWQNIVVEMKEFFDPSSLQSINRKYNKALVFKCGENPQQYVTQKLAFLKEIDKNMSEKKKVKNLIRGLPLDLQLQFSSQDIETTGQFLKRLRQYSEILEENKAKQTPSSQKPSSSLKTESLQAVVSNDSKRQINANRETRTCFYCKTVGHISRDCRLKQEHLATQQTPHNRNARIPPLFPRPPNGRGGYPHHQFKNFPFGGAPNFFNPYYNFMQYPMTYLPPLMPPMQPLMPPIPPPMVRPPFNQPRQRPPLPPQRENILNITEVEQPQDTPPQVVFPEIKALPEN